ncbi:MAG: hypothetical protein R2874_06045 [Desulfobacterales bacterium]
MRKHLKPIPCLFSYVFLFLIVMKIPDHPTLNPFQIMLIIQPFPLPGHTFHCEPGRLTGSVLKTSSEQWPDCLPDLSRPQALVPATRP